MARRLRPGLGWWWGGGAIAAVVVLFAAPRIGAAAENEFPVPSGLGPAVRMWTRVFAALGPRDVVVHDRFEPGLVYEVVRDVAPGDDARVRARLDAIAGGLALTGPWMPAAHELLAPPRPTIAPAARLRAQHGLRDSFAQGLLAERLFRPIVRRALAAEELPTDLAALPLVESSYVPGVVSDAGAAGLWQLRTAAAEHLSGEGRRDPVRSSLAAARHLRALYARFRSWPLAITAYEYGAAGVERARRAVGSDDLGAIVRSYDGPGFGCAARNYYAEFLAARRVLRHAEDYFPEMAPGHAGAARRLVAYRVKRGDTLATVARRHGVTIPALRATNGIRSTLLRPGQVLLIRL
jgi:peptidoglycan lytic transglycosylase D